MFTDRRRVALAVSVALAAVLVPVGVRLHPAAATAPFKFTRLAGPDRYATAATVATAAFPTAATVLLATGQNFPDALAGNYLAGVRAAPILLTTTDPPVPQATLTALSTLKAKHVILLGQVNAISQAVETQLSSTASGAGGNLDVSRIGGATRYDTMRDIIETSGASPGAVNGLPTAIVASGANFPDALSAGPAAYAKALPVVLTDPQALSPQASQVLHDVGIKQVIIEGGAVAVSAGDEAAIHNLGITTLVRNAGADRSETSKLAAENEVATLGFKDSVIDVATGEQSLGGADALVGGPDAGLVAAPILVTTSSADPGKVVDYATELAATLATGTAFGGPLALPDAALNTITLAAQTPPAGGQFKASTGGDPAAVAVSGTRQFAFTGTGPALVDIKLAACQDVHPSSAGSSFVGTNPAGAGNVAAFPTSQSAKITVLNGTHPSPAAGAASNVQPQPGGVVSLTVTDATSECVVPVAYESQNGTVHHALPLDGKGVPSVPYGVGGQTNFVPPDGTSGNFAGFTDSGSPTPPGGTVTLYDTAAQYIVVSTPGLSQSGTTVATYHYLASDTFQAYNASGQPPKCVAIRFDQFQAALSLGDGISGVYTPTGTSTFCVNDTAPSAPATINNTPPGSNGVTLSASTAGVAVSFPDSGDAGVVSYNVYRVGAASCPPDLSSPVQIPPQAAAGWAKVGSLADASALGAAEPTDNVFTDTTVVGGTS
ncbi:MAG: cell wall-binding repeat-containing protein [Acidimicrobiales bacterium]